MIASINPFQVATLVIGVAMALLILWGFNLIGSLILVYRHDRKKQHREQNAKDRTAKLLEELQVMRGAHEGQPMNVNPKFKPVILDEIGEYPPVNVKTQLLGNADITHKIKVQKFYYLPKRKAAELHIDSLVRFYEGTRECKLYTFTGKVINLEPFGVLIRIHFEIV